MTGHISSFSNLKYAVLFGIVAAGVVPRQLSFPICDCFHDTLPSFFVSFWKMTSSIQSDRSNLSTCFLPIFHHDVSTCVTNWISLISPHALSYSLLTCSCILLGKDWHLSSSPQALEEEGRDVYWCICLYLRCLADTCEWSMAPQQVASIRSQLQRLGRSSTSSQMKRTIFQL